MMHSSKTLVYGFGPYGEFEQNISDAVIQRLRRRQGLVKEVFPTRFSRTLFLDALRRHAPATVIGLGQHRTGHKLRLERRAVNRMGHRGKVARPIDPAGPERLFVNLHLPETMETTVTYDAGAYVCNFSMYWMLRACLDTGRRFAFIHIPRHYDEAAATAYVSLAIQAARRIG